MPLDTAASTAAQATTTRGAPALRAAGLRAYAQIEMCRTTNARFERYAQALGDALGLPGVEVARIARAAPFYDIGKLQVPSEVLHKPGPLSHDEAAEMRRHVHYGAEVIAQVAPRLGFDAEDTETARVIARHHHERYDGGGYPDGLAGDDIPLPARIIAIADVYDSLRAERWYKPAYSHARAVEVIVVGDGRTAPTHFDPRVLEAFRAVEAEIAEIAAT